MKKGFTLVELLAVIVVLSVIILIAGTNILGGLNNGKKQLNELSKKNLEDAAIAYAIDTYSIPGKPEYITDACAVNHEVTKLSDEGFLEDKKKVCDENATLLIYKYKNGGQSDFRVYLPSNVCGN